MDAARIRALYKQAREGDEAAANELAEVLHEVRLAASRRRLIDFTRFTFGTYRTNWHHEVIASYLDRVALSQLEPENPAGIRRLMIFVPPRHGKSELASRRFPAYMLGRNPDLHVVAASYNADLARSMNRDTQRVIDQEPYRELFPETFLSGTRVKTDHRGSYLRNADEFECVGKAGGYKSVGVGGGITGRGFDVGIIDDPVKGRDNAESVAFRRKVWDWYHSDFYTRRDSKNAAIILIMTRWHEDDLAGKLLEQQREEEEAGVQGERWHVIWLPALREHENPFKVETEEVDQREEEGAALWPEQFDKQELEITMRKSERDAASLYQQRPAAKEGQLFLKHWELSHRREGDTLFHPDGRATSLRECVRFTTNDLACSEQEQADDTCVSSWAWCRRLRHLFLIDVDMRRMTGPEHIPAIRRAGDRLQGDVTHWIESTGFQLSLVQNARSKGLAVRELVADKDKVARALPATALMEEGVVSFPESASWKERCLRQLYLFPNATHDDFVDTVSYAARVANDLARLSVFSKGSGEKRERYDNEVTTRTRW